ncbi:NAD(P)H-hydrate dehydratase [Nakamurella lactea]|uniref:NAD(P)H-hydrate dehydratase n=1 Tax=Nakamurella lactea TaxID=459515 RepID=UPI0004155931|nr:NAD(P)H-hydrate dehydratase [Nakamurella lactea]
MIPAFTVSQLRAAEQTALAAAPDGMPMQRAARAVATVAISRLPRPLPGRRVLLLVGSGNNGGDALFAGALLRRRGVAVTALLADPAKAHPAGLGAFRRAGGRVVDAAEPGPVATFAGVIEDTFTFGGDFVGVDLVIDGLVGIGARPPLRPAAARLARLTGNSRAEVLAVDLPSGIDPDTGDEDGPAVSAAVTVTFGAPSTGLLASERTGELVIADLGLAPEPEGLPDAWAMDDADVETLRPRPGSGDDKYSGGVTGVLAGSARYPGAAVLATGAAVRLRPGLVRYAGPQAEGVLARWPEVVAAAEPADAGRVQAWLAGPGMGTDGRALSRLLTVLEQDVPVLVDADGLTLLAEHPTLLPMRTGRDQAPPTVLTPHAGEFARLWPDLDPTRRVAAARAAARAADAVVLLKGHRTVIAAPDGRTAVNVNGTAWLASAGSGDVLSGVISSLLAAGLDPFLAAAVGARLHGRAGERAERAGIAGAQALWDQLN